MGGGRSGSWSPAQLAALVVVLALAMAGCAPGLGSTSDIPAEGDSLPPITEQPEQSAQADEAAGSLATSGTAEASTPPPSDTPQADSVSAPMIVESVVVLGHGEEPRSALRLTATEPQLRTFRYRQTQETFEDLQGQERSVSGPLDLVATMSITTTPTASPTTAQGDGGAYEIITEVIGAELGPGSRELGAIGVTVAPLIGFGSESILDPSARPLQHRTFGVPDTNYDRFVTDTAEPWALLLPVLPDEPVGEGAQWEVRLVRPWFGVEVNEVSLVTLASADEAQLILDVTTERELAGIVGEDPNGQTVTVLEGTERAVITLDRVDVVPASLTLVANTERVLSGGSRTRTKVSLAINQVLGG